MTNYFDHAEYFEATKTEPQDTKKEGTQNDSGIEYFKIDDSYYTIRRSQKKTIGHVVEQD